MISNPVDIKASVNDNLNKYKSEVLSDLWVCLVSREASLLGRKEVLTGKAKFGILGDGKEVPQVAMARAFEKGDFRSGYYRDQTFMFAVGLMTVEQYFAQLYADPKNDPFSGGRQMNAHFASPLIDSDGGWLDHNEMYNISSDISCTGGQMARGLGLAQASQKFRSLPNTFADKLTKEGNEVVFVTIGDASTSEGVFWETLNAAGVMSVPMVVSVWDDGYGISVPKEYQTVKGSISRALEGMRLDDEGNGMLIETVKGYDYPALVAVYDQVVQAVREDHVPALIHVQDLTQPQGHSTSGSHERYKSKDRLQWENEHDCIEIMIDWVVKNALATNEEIDLMRSKAKSYVKDCATKAWDNYTSPAKALKQELVEIIETIKNANIAESEDIREIEAKLQSYRTIHFAEVTEVARQLLFKVFKVQHEAVDQLRVFIQRLRSEGSETYNTHLYSSTANAALNIPYVDKEIDENSKNIPGYQVLNTFFDIAFERDNTLLAFGEDVGHIGDVNQGFAGLQEKYGVDRIFDTGIREWTIMGQAIGLAMRGWRPIAEIQYLDYLIYGLEPLTDDLATLRYRSNGMQHAPAIIRTRGHRLEGIWHAGSPIGLMINSLRGMYICTPRNMVQAAGMYNTLLQSDDPAIVVESLNGYRIREVMPNNIGTYTVPLGKPEVLVEGTDVTLVTYGSMVRIGEVAVKQLAALNISVELIDVQTLLPFDLEHEIAVSLQKTNRLVLLDEDLKSGATAFMMQKILEEQNGYQYLDALPTTLASQEHRTPFGSDGDYFTKPNVEDIVERIYAIMHESDPGTYPAIF